MSYAINDINLSVFGFTPGRAPQSNVALSGCWDMPSREGKVFHDWKDQQGVEPFLDAEYIRLGGRDLSLYGFIRGSDQEDAISKLKSLLAQFNSYSDLVTLSTSWQDYSVYVKTGYQARYEGNGLISIKLNFREPVLDYSGGAAPPVYDPVSTVEESQLRLISGIDGESFESLGLSKLLQRSLDLPEMKDGFFTSYETEGYQVTPFNHPEMELTFLLRASDSTEFNSLLKGLYNRFKNAGYRYFTVGADAVASFFVDQGFRVGKVNLTSTSMTGEIKLKVKFETLEPTNQVVFALGFGSKVFTDPQSQLFTIPNYG